MAMKLKKKPKYLVHFILIIGAITMVFPFLWMVLTALKTYSETTTIPPTIFPAVFQWKNFIKVMEVLPFSKFYVNTAATAVLRTLGQLFFCSMAAYAFARIKFPGRDVIFIVLLSVMMVPPQSFIIPNYMLMVKLGWLNSLKALIIPGLFSIFGTFLLRQFFMTFPVELEESGTLDGCNQFQVYWYIMLPLAKPGLIALSIFTMLWSWNELMWPLIVNSSPGKMTLAVGLASLQGQYLTNYTLLMSGALISILPMLIMFIILQRHFIEGITLTGTKG